MFDIKTSNTLCSTKKDNYLSIENNVPTDITKKRNSWYTDENFPFYHTNAASNVALKFHRFDISFYDDI